MKVFISIVFLLTGAFFLSCTDIADISPREKIVSVYCILTNDSVQTVDLRYSSYTSESYYELVKDAQVKVSYQLDTVWVNELGEIEILDTVGVYDFKKVEDGKWQAEFEPMENVQYTLEVLVSGEAPLTAVTRFPKKVDIQGVNYGVDPVILYTANMPVKSVSGSRNTNDPIINYKVSGPITLWIYGMDYKPDTKNYKVADYLYTNHLYLDKFNQSDKTKYDLNFNQSSVNLDSIYRNPGPVYWWNAYSYPYVNAVLPLQLWVGDRVDYYKELPSNEMFTTLWPCNDGLFCHKYLRIQQPKTNDIVAVVGSLHMPDEDDGRIEYLYGKYGEAFVDKGETDYFTVCVNFNEWKYLAPHPLSHLVFESVSAEYDKYMKDLVSYNLGTLQNIENSDITHIWERIEVYSNINNGKGIFGASSKEKVLWGMNEYYYEKYLEVGEENF